MVYGKVSAVYSATGNSVLDQSTFFFLVISDTNMLFVQLHRESVDGATFDA